MFLPHPRVKVSIVGSLRDREVACSASDRQGLNFESCVWRTVSSQSSHHPQEVLLAQFSLYVHKGGLKPDSFHFISCTHEQQKVCRETKTHIADLVIFVCLNFREFLILGLFTKFNSLIFIFHEQQEGCRESNIQRNTRRLPGVCIMLGQRWRRWPNIVPALGKNLVFARICTAINIVDLFKFV